MSVGERESTHGDRDHVQSLERGIAVLLAFDEEHPEPTLAELSRITGFSRPAVRRFLITLERMGYVRGHDGRWSLTPRVLSIGQHYTASHALIEVSQPHLLRLAEETHESASLATLDGDDAVYVARVPVRRIMSINVSVGTRVPAYATSMGRVLLAWAPTPVVDSVLHRRPLRAITPSTVTDPSALRAELARVREQGWAVVAEELEAGLLSASAPVRDRSGQVVAALASSTSVGRSSRGELQRRVVPLLLETAARITAEFGGRA
ncbi:IclR family transcriptional regulator [Geodermatophilus sp. TF02-6]|uniref:IclR family transcriptional regulator domain-containing protein n=1 Tax=Geodermatophilus sp. TF02-6 TaxID=2250575 RepID=UPI000DEAFB63|nr:IclR family transcriptional regulator C-terminal domain-containing protein [Geodermatophilus sp. TF02-6]RBY76402.1 IclR family transcriptional regulator [Geodermatophilus sp. TF02-6]